jgi:hypothetical protein
MAMATAQPIPNSPAMVNPALLTSKAGHEVHRQVEDPGRRRAGVRLAPGVQEARR